MEVKNKRLKRFLYNLGFEFELKNIGDREIYVFEDTDRLKECVEFYHNMRKTFRNDN